MLNERERKIERKFKKKDEKGKGTIWRRMGENKNLGRSRWNRNGRKGGRNADG